MPDFKEDSNRLNVVALVGRPDVDADGCVTSLSDGTTLNPTLEEQALARIHRLGQSREVETVRFYVRDSFEEGKINQVMKMQESKKQLAGVLLSPHDREGSDDNLGTLEKLRSLL
ncbi:hypothetical protein F5Y14DRAFT_448935 [Nemania sp. NC0429]|nr:hypothetical protein F5Y14DRAFT_448935 [Nemania sp. NC0429]